jgi:shikimate kinase / 3-dehydroquinate synthase
MMLKANPKIFIYGPPGSGKSGSGLQLARALDLPFIDLDAKIEARCGLTIPEIFQQEGEAGFRQREKQTLGQVLENEQGVIALGGGTLLDLENRQTVEEAGAVVCLSASLPQLLARLQDEAALRPLLVGDLAFRLPELMTKRAEHYGSFPLKIDTDGCNPEEIAWDAQVRLGFFRVGGMGKGYAVRVQPGGMDYLGALLQQLGLQGRVVVVSDANVAGDYGGRVIESLGTAGYPARLVTFPAGEAHKTMQTVAAFWEAFLDAGIDRSSAVIALGGGVTGDLAGFAAATYMRGIAWVAVPTSLLAMIDASLGGKTGADLPQGKNLVGAFHPPRLVLADPEALSTLPDAELHSGMAEVVKAGIIGDAALFTQCAMGWEASQEDIEVLLKRAMAVKIRLVQADPYETGARAALNLGHTFGHALEAVSHYQLRHGEAVAIGMVAAARLAESLGVAQTDLTEEIACALQGLGLPIEVPSGLDWDLIQAVMRVDKKRSSGNLRFVLPVRIGEVRLGVGVDDLVLVRSALFPAK